MKIFDTMRGKAAIQETADRFGQSPEQVRRDMQEAIDAAWASDDPAALELQHQLFPEGKPTPERFILALSKVIR